MRSIAQLMSLSGRSALVTGGAGHLGRAISEALLEAGANVALADRSPEMLKLAAESLTRDFPNAKISAHVVDLAEEAATRSLPGMAHSALGSLEILVNCAAFVGTSELKGWGVPFAQQATVAWRQALEVNVTAAFELTQECLPFFAQSEVKASIINVASIYGLLGPDWALYEGTQMANPAGYGASKGALIQLTRYLATTLGPEIRVNSISPGGVARNQDPKFVGRYEARTPLRRMAIEEDFKGAALYLASDLSSYVTGQDIAVDGGWSAW
jgi:NAD(P)-dependent dehydrogenase (short-subunit alcohol dehydrogenase family)